VSVPPPVAGLCSAMCNYSVLPQQRVAAAENPAGGGDLEVSAGSGPEESAERCVTRLHKCCLQCSWLRQGGVSGARSWRFGLPAEAEVAGSPAEAFGCRCSLHLDCSKIRSSRGGEMAWKNCSLFLSLPSFTDSSLVWNRGKFEWGKCEPRDACTQGASHCIRHLL